MTRTDAIFAEILGRFPGRSIRERTASRHRVNLAGIGPPVEFIDGTLQDIGGPPDAFGLYAVKVYADDVVFYLSDFELPPPPKLPNSQCVKLMRVANGLDPAPRMSQ